MTTTEAKALLEKINEIKETEAPMPHVYHQGWQDACSRIAEEIAALHHADRGGDGPLREVASEPEVTTQALSARVERLEEALWIARPHVAASVSADHMWDGFGPRSHQPSDDDLARIDAALTPQDQP